VITYRDVKISVDVKPALIVHTQEASRDALQWGWVSPG
jgi:hypothetical protein